MDLCYEYFHNHQFFVCVFDVSNVINTNIFYDFLSILSKLELKSLMLIMPLTK